VSSYKAIARRWRPATFEEISGQGHVTRTLQNALRLGRIHHAFLFTGARGVGKTTAARTLARALNCEQGATPTPCGTCSSCLEIVAGNSTDVVEIDGASNNSVDDVRELREAVRYLPSRDRYRVYIIDEVHMLSIGAFNALLKTLEEPPEHVVFIFATTEPQKIPDTILSRVQRFDFKRIPIPTVVARLKQIIEAEGIEIPEEALRLIARAGEGSMRDSQSLLDQVIAFGGERVDTDQVADLLGLVDRGLLYGFLEGLVQGKPEDCLDAIAQVYDYGHEISQFTTELLELLRNAALVALSPSARKHLDLPQEEIRRLEQVVQGVDAQTISRWFQVLLKVHDEVSRSPRPRLVLEMAVARVVAVRPLIPVDTLLERIEDLERRLRQRGARLPDRPARLSHPTPEAARPDPEAARPAPQAARPPDPVPPAPEPVLSLPEPAAAPPTARPVPPTEPPITEVARQTPPKAATKGWGPPKQATWGATSGGPRFRASKPVKLKEEESDEGPSVPQDAGDEARLQALQDWLPKAPRFRVVCENAAFGCVEDSTLELLVPDVAALTRARRHEKDEMLLRGIALLWPGCRRVRFVERMDRSGETVRETRDRHREEHQQKLIDEARSDPLLKEVCEVLGATITTVQPLQEHR